SKGKQNEKDKMAKFFKEYYRDTEKVALFDFYEDYYKKVKVPEYEEQNDHDSEKGERIGSRIDPLKNWDNISIQWAKLFKNKLNEHNEKNDTNVLHINQRQIEKINSRLNLRGQWSKRNSMGAFVQFYKDAEESAFKGVINGTFAGYGK